MSVDIRIFNNKKNTCLHITIGNSPVSSSIHWLDIIKEQYEGDHPTNCEVMYAWVIWTFWTYKQFRKKKTMQSV